MKKCLNARTDPIPWPLVLAGATASGKSSVAVELACQLGAAVVNGDPFQAWRGMPVLTAQPQADELARAPHYLYGVIDPTGDRDANGFAMMVNQTLATLAARGTPAIIVSGSGLYLRTLTSGLDDGLPAPSPQLRAELEALPLDRLLAELHDRDPAEFARIDRHNPRRVIRAVEICRLTSQAVSSLRRSRDLATPRPLAGIVLDLPADSLKSRIHDRADQMVGPQLAAEIDGLSGMELSRTAAQTLGLAIARDWRAGRINRDEAVAALVARTWQYARRQRTWFRRTTEFLPQAVADGTSPSDLARAILARFRT